MYDRKQRSTVFLVTGKVQGGKTTFLRELVELFKKRGITVGGFLCPGHFDAGERSGFQLKNIITGKELPMATVRESPGWIKYRRFWFNPDAFRHGKEWIRESLLQGHQVMVIDEVGPMELEHAGWSELLDQLVISYVPVQLWSVREKLVRKVLRQWNIPDGNVLDIAEANAFEVKLLFEGILKGNREPNQNQ
jgi:nucleoside-triphosphatase THEP1